MNRFKQRKTLVFLLAGTMIMILTMIISGKPLNTSNTPAGILHLELANSSQEVNQILLYWNDASVINGAVVTAAKINTYFDFLFLLFYVMFLYSCCIQLAGSLLQFPAISNLLNIAAGVIIVAGLLDVIENAGMLISLEGHTSNSIAMITATASIIKWAMVVAVLILLITGFTIKLYKKIKGRMA